MIIRHSNVSTDGRVDAFFVNCSDLIRQGLHQEINKKITDAEEKSLHRQRRRCRESENEC
jgi:hypothetical protein